jgi:predicted AAA+ superfamily ATPase
MIPDARYCNCDLPSAARELEDPEAFFSTIGKGTTVIFDEIHRLPDPSRLLKIGADAFPGIRMLATGSSTLAATRKFRDTLTGRKHALYLPPVLWTECVEDFGVRDLDRRLFHGGLPEPLLASAYDASFYGEWMDSFYARDVQELFNIRNRTGFLKLLRLLMHQSGGMADYTRLSSESGLTRPTVMAHLEALSAAHAVFLLPPYHGGGKREMTRRPKCYAFDTGMVSYAKGWESVRDDDRGLLWEHLVLDALRTFTPAEGLHYWRDKSGREIDFVVGGGRTVNTVECKINPDRFAPDSLSVFRGLYPKGTNWVVCPLVPAPFTKRFQGHEVRIVPLRVMGRELGFPPL